MVVDVAMVMAAVMATVIRIMATVTAIRTMADGALHTVMAFLMPPMRRQLLRRPQPNPSNGPVALTRLPIQGGLHGYREVPAAVLGSPV